MGNWNINIQGVGCHHNNNTETDANLLAAEFVAYLKRKGHSIESATFTFGSKMDLIPIIERSVRVTVQGMEHSLRWPTESTLTREMIIKLSGVKLANAWGELHVFWKQPGECGERGVVLQGYPIHCHEGYEFNVRDSSIENLE